MAGNIARVQPKVLDPVLLTKVAKRVAEVGKKIANAQDELGDFLFDTIFNGKLEEAVRFRHNAYYRSLLSMAKTDALGNATAYWIKKVVHVNTMTRVLAAAKKDKFYKQMSYTHKGHFVGIDFSRVDFVAATSKKGTSGTHPPSGCTCVPMRSRRDRSC
jgi:hypothetical protein